MQVELVPHVMTGVRSKQPVHLDQYQVMVDNRLAGYLSFAPGSRMCLIRQFGPLEREEMETQVAALLKSAPIQSEQVPNVPPEYRQQLTEQEEGIDASDID